MDYTLELVMLPVTDVDRAKAFYVEQAGFELQVDHSAGDSFRIVQLGPPGSTCSIGFGIGMTDMTPGSVRGLHLMVDDIVAARAELHGRGLEIGDVRHMGANGQWSDGPDPARRDYNSFAHFSDPDGNSWVIQERGFSTSAER